MNKWKISFWVTLAIWLITIIIMLYVNLILAESLIYNENTFDWLESDYTKISKVLIESKCSKKNMMDKIDIDKKLKYLLWKQDTIVLSYSTLVFENDTLKEIIID